MLKDFARLAMCVNDEDLFVHREKFAWSSQAKFEIELVPCRNSTENGDSCKDPDETQKWKIIAGDSDRLSAVGFEKKYIANLEVQAANRRYKDEFCH